jgi:hypothetical protein
MRVMTIAVFTGLSLTLPVAARGQSLQGSWDLVEATLSGGRDTGVHTNDIQPGVLVFGDTRYALVMSNIFQPRPRLPAQPSDQEIRAAYGSLSANAGSYTATDTLLTTVSSIAKNPNGVGTPVTWPMKLQGDTLWLTTRGMYGAGVTGKMKWIRAATAKAPTR